jgi:formylglycine-generating enzyme required for sulfatase activity
MLGNVSEWTGSWYDSAEYNRSAPSVTDPQGPQQGEEIVVRGCTYESAEEACRCSSRGHQHPRSRHSTGFRVAHDAE